MSEEILDQEKDRFDDMSIAQLRSYAKLIGATIGRDYTTEDIKRVIRAKQKKGNFIAAADTSSDIPPGRYRIVIHKDTEFGVKAGSRPVTVTVNSVPFTMPRGVPCDVPEKVVRVLENSVHYTMSEDAANEGPGKGMTLAEVKLSYPFQVLGMTPGPDPMPGSEKSKARYYLMRKAFCDEFGYWPKNRAMLDEAIKEGLIKRATPEFVAVNSTKE